MPVIMKDNVQYAYTTKGTVFHTLSNAEYEALTEEEKMNGDVYCIPDREPVINPDQLWEKVGTGTLDIGDDLTDGVNQLNSSLTIEEIPTSDIITAVSGVTVSSRACWKIGKFVFLNAVFTISNPTQGVNDLATYNAGYAPSVAYIQPAMSYATGNDAGTSSLLNLRPTKLDVEHTGGKPYLLVSVIYKVA